MLQARRPVEQSSVPEIVSRARATDGRCRDAPILVAWADLGSPVCLTCSGSPNDAGCRRKVSFMCSFVLCSERWDDAQACRRTGAVPGNQPPLPCTSASRSANQMAGRELPEILVSAVPISVTVCKRPSQPRLQAPRWKPSALPLASKRARETGVLRGMTSNVPCPDRSSSRHWQNSVSPFLR